MDTAFPGVAPEPDHRFAALAGTQEAGRHQRGGGRPQCLLLPGRRPPGRDQGQIRGPARRNYARRAALLRALVDAAEKAGIWTLQAGILRENAASISLHKKAGFREVGYRERIGRLNGVWRDVVLLERRSPVVGVA